VKATARSIRQFLQIAMLGAGAYLAIRQIITPGVMIVASIIMARALAPVEVAITSWRGFLAARSSYGRLQRLMAEVGETAVTMELPAPTGALAVEDLVAAPPGIQKPVIKGISFALPAGETLGIIGPSAAGKSTLARLLVGVWTPMAGHVRLDSADVSQWDRDALGPHLGYLPQDVELFDGTVSENIARFSEPDPEQVVIAAKRAGAHDMILRLPDGYDTLIGEAGNMLSGGQKQRVALARALYGDPAIVVLDEPNSNLDAEGEAALQTAVAELKARGKTVVVIAHRPSIVSRADKLLVLRDGRVEMLGAPDEILSRVTHAVASKGTETSGSDESSSNHQRAEK
jgi:PrtD family type I secretion system ABC transporter